MEEEAVRGPVALLEDEKEEDDEGLDNEDDDDNEIDTEKLLAYEKSRLRYYYAIVECDSIAAADHLYKACDGVEQLLDPAIKGTNNVLRAVKEAGVKQVVVTSSIFAITLSPNWPADVVKDKDCLADIIHCKQKGFHYVQRIDDEEWDDGNDKIENDCVKIILVHS